MFTKKVGRIEINASDPSPTWFTIEYNRGSEIEIFHGMGREDLVDLKYAIERTLERVPDR